MKLYCAVRMSFTSRSFNIKAVLCGDEFSSSLFRYVDCVSTVLCSVALWSIITGVGGRA
jgi:hypothetical protein